MNLKQLEAFVKVTESGSFSKAAKLLFLTQPTVSAHISSLEKELDSRLFVRNTKEVKLSEEGKQLYQYARQMVELEKEIEQVFSKDAHREEKCITIATSTIRHSMFFRRFWRNSERLIRMSSSGFQKMTAAVLLNR